MEEIINNLLNEEYEIRKNVSFKELTSYKVGGICRYLVLPYNNDSLIKLINNLKSNNISYKIFGNGTNLLVSDKNYDGVIIKLTRLNAIEKDDTTIRVGAGYNFGMLANNCSREGLSGLEWACGIPGTIGGAVYMNAGAYLKSISDVLVSVEVLDSNNKIITLQNSDLNYSYRKSLLMEKDYVVLNATLKLEHKNKDEILKLITDRRNRRMESQPLEFPSAGSVFRNPEGDFAGRLIEECMLKGKVIGGAQISNKHANFIINKQNATANDIKSLIDIVKENVYNKFKVELHVEQELFNWE